jgi:hypothetical protein
MKGSNPDSAFPYYLRIPLLTGRLEEIIYIAGILFLNIKWLKMKNIRWMLFVGMIAGFGLISCSKTGNTGPAGPAGPAGPDSVYSSQWITLATTYNPADTLYEQTITAASITSKILDSGIILTYVNDGGGDVVPFSFFGLSSYEVYSVGQIGIFSVGDLSDFQYRYVTIPGKLLSGTGVQKKYKGFTQQELESMPYNKAQQVISDKN